MAGLVAAVPPMLVVARFVFDTPLKAGALIIDGAILAEAVVVEVAKGVVVLAKGAGLPELVTPVGSWPAAADEETEGAIGEMVVPIDGVATEVVIIAGVAKPVVTDAGCPIEPKVGENRGGVVTLPTPTGAGAAGGVAIPVPAVTVVPLGAGARVEGALLVPF